MTPKGILAAAGAALVAVGIGIVVTQSAATDPLPTVHVHTSCEQTVSYQPVYSGTGTATKIVAFGWQYGIVWAKPITGTSGYVNGIAPGTYPFCAPGLKVNCPTCDYHQSIDRLAASPNTPKWWVAAGAPYVDHFNWSGAQVFKWDTANSRIVFHAFIPEISGLAHLNRTRDDTPLLDGDFAYLQQSNGKFTKFDLNAKLAVAGDLPQPSTPPAQLEIDSYTYTIDPDPVPPGHVAATDFTLTRHGGTTGTPSPTVPPALTVTPVPTGPVSTKTTTAPPTVTRTKTPCQVCVPCTPTKTPHWGPNASLDYRVVTWSEP